MNCHVLTSQELLYRHESDALLIYGHMTKESSDYNRKLRAWLLRQAAPSELDGHIAVVTDHGEIVGWSRTERWVAPEGGEYDTLESFVAPSYRGRGVASFAANGLCATVLHDDGVVAVFAPKMLLVARRAGLLPTLYQRDEKGVWVAA